MRYTFFKSRRLNINPCKCKQSPYYFDGIMFKSLKGSQIVNKCAYSILGIDMKGQKDILSILD